MEAVAQTKQHYNLINLTILGEAVQARMPTETSRPRTTHIQAETLPHETLPLLKIIKVA
jgi:hypothetical protein